MALGWVFAVGGGARVCVHQDGQGVMQGGQNESGWVGIGESLIERGVWVGEVLSESVYDVNRDHREMDVIKVSGQVLHFCDPIPHWHAHLILH